jgi:HD superfamily phosphohydrolase YqeK
MIDLEKAKNEFINYTNNYDSTNPHISRKIGHTFRVMEWSRKIAESLNLSQEDIDLATLIGLLHDLARFEQRRLYDTFSDSKSVDHGDLAVTILEENEYIRKYVEDNKYDDIIKIAVKNHNKFKIEDGLDEKTLLHSKIVRDADKIDIMYEGVHMFYKEPDEIEQIENLPIAEEYYNQFIDRKQIFRKKDPTVLDGMICLFSFIFDLNFEFSKKSIVEGNYINDILNRFNFKNEQTKMQIEEIKKISCEFLK